jgi:hypothetical protein
MTPGDINEYAQLVRVHYPETFRVPPPMQLLLWHTDLASYTPEEALEALRRWVRWHGDSPPQLGELVRRCQEVRADAAQWHRGLEEPSDLTPDQASFGQLMAHLATRAVSERLSMPACAQLCVQWAEANFHRPALARELLSQAQAYRALETRAESRVLSAELRQGATPQDPGTTLSPQHAARSTVDLRTGEVLG